MRNPISDFRKYEYSCSRRLSRASLIPILAPVLAPLLATVSPPGMAQDQETAPGKGEKLTEEVVVTGTYIRGIKPTGSQVIGISKEEITASGAVSSTELLGSLPQATNLFNSRTTVSPGAAAQLQIVRPNLRNLPGENSATGAATLILVDGHRVPGVGVRQVATDPDMVPPGIIQRVEIITDGGSSIYGADAVGGVINFITLKGYEGVKLDAGYSVGDDYTGWDTNLTAGTAWGNGSAYISYSAAEQDEILGKDRDWQKRIDWNTGLPYDTACAAPNVRIGSTNYASPAYAANTTNRCDNTQLKALSPHVEREGVFVGLNQVLSESVEFDVTAFYSERTSSSSKGPAEATTTMTAANPYYQNIDGSGSNQQLIFNMGEYGAHREESSSFKSWGITPEFKISFADDWQLRTLFNYGKSESDYHQPGVNSTLLAQYGSAATVGGAVNYYDLASTVNQDLIANILDEKSLGRAEDEIINVRAIADGGLFSLPGGEVRVALGAEYLEEEYRRSEGVRSQTSTDDFDWLSYKRHVSAVFGELQIPVIGANNRLPGVEAFDISLSVRHDDYSDFGKTTNPKIGFTYVPVEWVTVRGNWGESFNAPTPVDQLSSQFNTFSVFPFIAVVNPNDGPTGAESQTVAVQGAAPELKPQTATTWSLGLDLEPPVMPGFRASLSYYEIEFEGTLRKPPAFNAPELYRYFPEYAVVHPSDADLVEASSYAVGGDATVAPLLGTNSVYNIIYYITDNIGTTNIRGIDYAFDQVVDTSFGTLDFRLAGNYRLESSTQLNKGSPWIDDLEYDESKYTAKFTAGTNIGNFRAQLDYNYLDGYDVEETPTRPQSHVGAFETVDLYLRYAFDGNDWRENMTVTMNVSNLLDASPPEYRENGDNGYDNGFTLGRVFKVGLSKEF